MTLQTANKSDVVAGLRNPTDAAYLSTIEEILEEARQGRMFILIDDEDREKEGDLVCDLFGGSGTTAVAAATLGRLHAAVREVPDDRPRPNTITMSEYEQLKASSSVVLVDSRSERTFAETDAVPDSIRVHPERAIADAARHELPRTATLVVFCA